MDFTNRKYLNADSQKSLRTTTFQRKDIIFVKGESGQTMYEVLNGSVGVYLNYGKPDEVLLAVKRVGEYLGEIALIEDRPRTATAVAMEYDTMLREISINGFANYIKETPNIVLTFAPQRPPIDYVMNLQKVLQPSMKARSAQATPQKP